MRRFALSLALAAVTFAAEAPAARAQFIGWTRIPAPCAPTALAVTGEQIAVPSPDDRSISSTGRFRVDTFGNVLQGRVVFADSIEHRLSASP